MKTTLRFYLTPVRMAHIKKRKKNVPVNMNRKTNSYPLLVGG
jgi:hypothetical protein